MSPDPRRPRPLAHIAITSLAVAALVTLPACKQKRKVTALELAARESPAVLHVPRLAALADGANGALTTLGKDGLEKDIDNLRFAVTTALGFDPLTLTGLKQAGLDPERDLVIAQDATAKQLYAALPVADRERLERHVQRIFRELRRAEPHTETKHEGVTIRRMARKSGDRELVVGAYAGYSGYILVALQDANEKDGAAERLIAAIDRTSGDAAAASESIAHNPLYARLRQSLTATPPATFSAFVGRDGPMLSESQKVQAALVDVTLTATGLDARAALQVDPVQVQVLQPLLEVASAPPDFERLLGGRPFMALKLALKPEALIDYAEASARDAGQDLTTPLAEFNQAMGFEVRKDLVPLLTGHMLFTWELGDISSLVSGRVETVLDALVSGKLLKPALTLQTRDPAAVDALTARIEKTQLDRNIPMEVLQVGRFKVTRARPSVQGREQPVLWTRWDDTVVITFDQAVMEHVLAGGGKADPAAGRLLTRKDSQMLYLDLPRVTDAARQSMGDGTQGLKALTLKLFLQKAEKMFQHLGGVVVAADLAGDRATLTVSLSLR